MFSECIEKDQWHKMGQKENSSITDVLHGSKYTFHTISLFQNFLSELGIGRFFFTSHLNVSTFILASFFMIQNMLDEKPVGLVETVSIVTTLFFNKVLATLTHQYKTDSFQCHVVMKHPNLSNIFNIIKIWSCEIFTLNGGLVQTSIQNPFEHLK